MKFRILSDLHLESCNWTPTKLSESSYDAVILAGDIGYGLKGKSWYKTHHDWFNRKPALFVPGNHEYYNQRKRNIQDLQSEYKLHSNPVFRIIDNSLVEYPNEKLVVLGATLWTDFRLNGNQLVDMYRAPMCLHDFDNINWAKDIPLLPVHLLQEHENSIQFIKKTCKDYKSRDWKVVVVTHHAPTLKSIPSKYLHHTDNVYFTNALDMDYEFVWPDLWVHGHVHSSASYELFGCRVVCNPKGYRGYENDSFNDSLIIEV